MAPYNKTLGIPHALTSVMWLCGPIAGLIVQPCVGLYSDKCTSSLGRRRPFILTGCIIICISVIVIGFSSDIGYALGDTTEDCKVYRGPRYHAAAAFILGFWLLDFSNNTVQGPARALMADLSGRHGPSAANAIFCSWMALGNILGYSSGSTNDWHKWFPFLMTRACCEACANLKAAFLVAVVFLGLSTAVTMVFAREVALDPVAAAKRNEGEASGLLAVFKGMKNLPVGMPSVLIVTGLTWLSWFPFILFDTDWMGREIYHGRPDGSPAEVTAFQEGVRQGAFGLLLNSLAASRGGGQGLCTGVLNISIVVPQMAIALGAGPWDELFGEGNIPAFAMASVFAAAAAAAGVVLLPKVSVRSVSMAGGH
ncbi:hypothetical protein OsJ_29321 [Oryza sativa Japonica Group]|uniref:Uncharacterized protein n=1 Tax=Oryza sativa subsp. japonica TaxID=39947 RepID=B9G3I7_ORYSJ|nr:hypothetical protein OsJ_29321 [Oryza sativa Japonica Group]